MPRPKQILKKIKYNYDTDSWDEKTVWYNIKNFNDKVTITDVLHRTYKFGKRYRINLSNGRQLSLPEFYATYRKLCYRKMKYLARRKTNDTTKDDGYEYIYLECDEPQEAFRWLAENWGNIETEVEIKDITKTVDEMGFKLDAEPVKVKNVENNNQ